MHLLNNLNQDFYRKGNQFASTLMLNACTQCLEHQVVNSKSEIVFLLNSQFKSTSDDWIVTLYSSAIIHILDYGENWLKNWNIQRGFDFRVERKERARLKNVKFMGRGGDGRAVSLTFVDPKVWNYG